MKRNKKFVDCTTEILRKNPEWEIIYERYAKSILKNSQKYKENSRKFQVNKPITVYSTIGKVINGTSVFYYDLRYAGQSIAHIEVDRKEQVKLYVSENQAVYARDKFGYENSKKLDGVDWKTDKTAKDFRRFYYSQDNIQGIPIKSEEHRIENLVLREIAKRTRSEHKLLCNIQPVQLGNKFFQLTTPLKASTHEPEISLTKERNGANGGGIDILARTVHKDCSKHLAIIELKDENRESEPQQEAMFQALTYATFIAHLLRSKSGSEWWTIFNFSKDIPQEETIELDVVTLMPEGNSTEGCLDSIDIEPLNVRLNLHTLYYAKDANGNPCSFSGTLTSVIKD